MPSPTLWGVERVVRERLRPAVKDLRMSEGKYRLRYPLSPPEVVEFYRAYYGPTNRAFAALGTRRRAGLRRELERLWSAHNMAGDGWTEVEAQYLAVMAVRL